MAFRVFTVINNDGADDVNVMVTKRIDTLDKAIAIAKANPNCGKKGFFGTPIVTIRSNNGRKVIMSL